MFLSGVVSYAVSRLDHPSPPASAIEAAPSPPPPTTAIDELTRLDGHIAFYRHRAETNANDWLDWDYVANAYMDRARITGDYADWRGAEAALDSAFRAEEGHGPFL